MNFLSLVNDVNQRLNEVPLTQNNFATAGGFYSQAKEAVNSALREINQDAFEWPFNHLTHEEPLVEGQVRYPYPAGAKTVNFDSFRIKGVPSQNIRASKLTQIDYEEYLDKYVDADYNPEQYLGTPNQVFRTPDFQYGLYPPPVDGLTVVFEHYSVPPQLVLWSDIPFIPVQFRHIIVDGAMHHAFMFRGDPESSGLMLNKFKEGIKTMRSVYQNRYEYVRSGYIPRRSFIK